MMDEEGMPTDWWAWGGDKLHPLGICDDLEAAWDMAYEKKVFPVHWIFSRESLQELRDQILEELA